MPKRNLSILLFGLTVLCTGCAGSNQVISITGSGMTLSVSGAVKTTVSSVRAVQHAGATVIATLQSMKENIENRLEKLQQGKELIEEAITQ